MDIIKRIEQKSGTTITKFNNVPCRIWLGGTTGTGRGGGYGKMSVNGEMVSVHIVSYTHHYGYIPPRKQIDHLCNNRLCWEPTHLEIVTHIKNQKRRAKRQKLMKKCMEITDERLENYRIHESNE